MNKVFKLLIGMATISLYAQRDTLSYNDVLVYKDKEGTIIYTKDQKSTFSGDLIFESDDMVCYQKVLKGKISKETCKDKDKPVVFDFEAFKKELSKYPIHTWAGIKTDSVLISSEYREGADYLKLYFRTAYKLGNETYTGIVKSNDSIFFYSRG